jgi:ribosome maturation factor RimP
VTALPQHVHELARRVAAGHGVEVLEATLRRQGRSQVLSVVLDADRPVEADVVEEVSKGLSRALDQADPLPGSYTLEVTTPGLDRPLRSARDFQRQRGHRVRVVLAGGGAAEGRVVDADAGSLTLEVDGDRRRLPLSDVVRGKVVLPW